jgi:hypothetical protein
LTVVTVTGTYLDTTGTPMSGTVSFKPQSNTITDAAVKTVLVAAAQTVTLDAGGAFSADLIASNDPDADTFVWKATFALVSTNGAAKNDSLTFALPYDGGSLDLTTVQPALVPPVTQNYVVSVNGQSGVVTIPTGGTGAVSTVNGKSPNGSGNVQLTASDVGADAAGAAASVQAGLGTAASHAATDFDAAGAASAAQGASLQKSANLSDVVSAATARTNLGLGTAATHAATDFASATSAVVAGSGTTFKQFVAPVSGGQPAGMANGDVWIGY